MVTWKSGHATRLQPSCSLSPETPSPPSSDRTPSPLSLRRLSRRNRFCSTARMLPRVQAMLLLFIYFFFVQSRSRSHLPHPPVNTELNDLADPERRGGMRRPYAYPYGISSVQALNLSFPPSFSLSWFFFGDSSSKAGWPHQTCREDRVLFSDFWQEPDENEIPLSVILYQF